MNKFITVILILIAGLNTSFKTTYKIPLQLDWETHFKGKADDNSPFFALTSTTWEYSYTSRVSKNSVQVKFNNTITLNPEKSWVKWDKIKDKETSVNLLHHEQGHVNIQNILLLDADRILKTRNYSVKNYKSEIAQLAQQIGSYYENLQKNYDIETAHGSNHKMQARWDKIIDDKTVELSATGN